MALPTRYRFNTARPGLSPAVRRSGLSRRIEDTARYILEPDEDFNRPYLAVPGVDEAFVWPLGAEGFEISAESQITLHRYLGEQELEVTISHKDEMHITMTGILPGWTSVANMNALRRIYNMDTPDRGKILHLPGILPNLQYVVGENLRFSHAEEDFTEDIAYTVSFIRTTAAANPAPVQSSAVSGPSVGSPKGSGRQVFVATTTHNTLQKIAGVIFKDKNQWAHLYSLNPTWFDENNIPVFMVPTTILPVGMKIFYEE